MIILHFALTNKNKQANISNKNYLPVFLCVFAYTITNEQDCTF